MKNSTELLTNDTLEARFTTEIDLANIIFCFDLTYEETSMLISYSNFNRMYLNDISHEAECFFLGFPVKDLESRLEAVKLAHENKHKYADGEDISINRAKAIVEEMHRNIDIKAIVEKRHIELDICPVAFINWLFEFKYQIHHLETKIGTLDFKRDEHLTSLYSVFESYRLPSKQLTKDLPPWMEASMELLEVELDYSVIKLSGNKDLRVFGTSDRLVACDNTALVMICLLDNNKLSITAELAKKGHDFTTEYDSAVKSLQTYQKHVEA